MCAHFLFCWIITNPPIETVLDSQFSAARIGCRSYPRLHRVPIAIRGSTGLLCIVVAIKIPSGDDKESGCVPLFSQSSERDRGEAIVDAEGDTDFIISF